jgi:hypothetical protein
MKSLEPESTLQKQFRQVHDQLVTIAREFSGMESANDRLISNNIARRITSIMCERDLPVIAAYAFLLEHDPNLRNYDQQHSSIIKNSIDQLSELQKSLA